MNVLKQIRMYLEGQTELTGVHLVHYLSWTGLGPQMDLGRRKTIVVVAEFES